MGDEERCREMVESRDEAVKVEFVIRVNGRARIGITLKTVYCL
jgi:hypothetical protein